MCFFLVACVGQAPGVGVCTRMHWLALRCTSKNTLVCGSCVHMRARSDRPATDSEHKHAVSRYKSSNNGFSYVMASRMLPGLAF